MILDDMRIDFEPLGDGTRLDFLGIDAGSSNRSHCIVTITNKLTGQEESFDFWNNENDPWDTSQETINIALSCIADDALNALWDEWESLECAGYDPASEQQVKRVSAESLLKLQRLDWSEQDMLDVSNMTRGY